MAAALDATGGLVQASAEDRATRAWQVDRPLDADALDGPRSWLRIGLLVLQGLAIVVVLVLCAADAATRGGPMSDASTARTPRRRRTRGPRIDVTVVLAVVLPLLALGAALLVRPDDIQPADVAPEQTALTRST